MKNIILFLIVCIIFTCCSAINVTQCSNIAKPIDNLQESVVIGSCKKPPCRLRKNSSIKIELKIKPEKDTEKIVNSIFAYIAGVPFPFPGVDQTDACKNIYSSDGNTKIGCPLKAGQEYLYKNEIQVLQIYPRIKTIVHWAITGPSGDIMCFEVPARITN